MNPSIAKSKYLGILLLFLSGIPTAYAETKVGGPISENTTWTAQGSPYIVTMHTEVTQGAWLTIKPGVVVRFDGPYFLKVSGQLIARGTEYRPILFTSNEKKPGAWVGILFEENSIGGSFNRNEEYPMGSVLESCRIEYAGGQHCTGRPQECYGAVRCFGSVPYIHRCIISNNICGIVLNNCQEKVIIKGNVIKQNTKGTRAHEGGGICMRSSTDVTVSCNDITNNSCGIFAEYSKGLLIRNNLISKNPGLKTSSYFGGAGILFSYSGGEISENQVESNLDGITIIRPSFVSLSKNLISRNSRRGVYVTGADVSQASIAITNNEITMNGTDGIHLEGTNPLKSYPIIVQCNIYENSGFAIRNQAPSNIQAVNNWWGTADELAIRGVIYDHWDKPHLGKVIIKPFLLAANAKAGVIEAVGPGAKPTYAAASVSNVQFSQDGNMVIIHYDFEGGLKSYCISLECSRDGGKTFDIIPKTLTGDVGLNITSGTNKTIRWEVLADYPKGLSGENFVFKIEINEFTNEPSLTPDTKGEEKKTVRNVNALMPNARLILGVLTQMPINHDKMLSDKVNYPGAYRNGEWIVWHLPASRVPNLDPSRDASHRGDKWPSDVKFTFALNRRGDFYIGAEGSKSHVLSMLSAHQYFGIDYIHTDKREQWIDLDLRQNVLGHALFNYYVRVESQPEGKFYRSRYTLFSSYERPIYVIKANLWSGNGQYDKIVHTTASDQWCPQWNYNVMGSSKRAFDIAYSGETHSFVSAYAYNDNGNSSYVSADGVILSSQSGFASNFKTYEDIYPKSVELGCKITWSIAHPYIGIAVVADSVDISEVHEWNAKNIQDPKDSLDQNPAPLIMRIEPGWNENISR